MERIMAMNADGTGAGGFQMRSADGTTYLACLPLEEAGFTAAFSTRAGAAPGEPTGQTARRLLEAIGRPGTPIATCKQVHSTTVRTIEGEAPGPETECDALTARQPGLLLGVKTADCVPVLIADRRTGAVAAVHAGWRGTAGRIVERTFAAMIASWATRRSDCLAAIGPAVCGRCYEVGPEVLERFRGEFPYAKRFVSDGEGGKGFVDLKAANAIQLEMCGLTPEQVFATDLCTICQNDSFPSYRREGERAGRILSVVGQAGA
jgi:YfiH family protein